jgi:hypothetical protein
VPRTAPQGRHGIDGGARENAALKKAFDVSWSEPVLFREVGIEFKEHAILGLVRKLGFGGLDKEGDLNAEVR